MRELIKAGLEMSGESPSEYELDIWEEGLGINSEQRVKEAFAYHYRFNDFAPNLKALCTFMSALGVNKIIADFAMQKGVSVDDLTGPDRKQPIVRYRQELMLLLRQNTDLSLTQIGARLGGRDHTTVLHGLSVVGGEAAA